MKLHYFEAKKPSSTSQAVPTLMTVMIYFKMILANWHYNVLHMSDFLIFQIHCNTWFSQTLFNHAFLKW